MKTHQIYGTLFTGITLVVSAGALADVVAIVLLLIVNDVERAAGGAGA